MVGEVAGGRLGLTEVHRFWNGPVRLRGTLHWDILQLFQETLTGLGQAARDGRLDGVGIDSWAVDYGLLDGAGRLLGNPVHYRDARTDGAMTAVLRAVPAEELYAVTGLQQLPFNTLYQLTTEPDLDRAAQLLLIPDLLGYWLTGIPGAEMTNASTTQLYDVRTRRWSEELARRTGIPPRLFPPLREPGDLIGPLLPEVAEEIGAAASTPVIAVGSHDTASSVVAVPAVEGEHFAYISSGTWSLVGLELPAPVLTDEARRADFTNEGGVDGRTRFLRNVMGLWLLQECLRAWDTADLTELLAKAADAPAFRSLVDPDDPSFLAPGNMPVRIGEYCDRTGQLPPASRPAMVRCVLESLAVAYRRTVRTAGRLAGQPVEVVHVVGGGVRNQLLCQLTADACGVPVLAGPVEASALGNVLVQARALGVPLPDLEAMRSLVRATHRPRQYLPQGREADWDAAEVLLYGGR